MKFQWFQDLKIKFKFGVCFLVMITGFVIACFLAWDVISTNEKLTEMALKARAIRNSVNTSRLALSEMIIRRYVNADFAHTEEDDLKIVRKETEAAVHAIDELQQMDILTKDRQASEMLNQIERVTKEYFAKRDSEQLPAISNNHLRRAAELYVGPNIGRFRTIRETAAALANRCAAIEQARGSEASFEFFVIGILMFGFSVVLFVMLNFTVALPLQAITAAANKLTLGDTALDLKIPGTRDEVGQLLRAFDSMCHSWSKMSDTAKQISDGDLSAKLIPRSNKDVFVDSFNILVENMATIASQFSDAVEVLTTSTSEILVSVVESAAGATQTATAANQTSSIVEEVKQTSYIASQKAKLVSDSAHKTAEITATGRQATEDIINGMNHIREQVDLIAEAMVRLSEKSQSISEIIASIAGLAKQSNLLAVNASIEAARAGELGRGFGVVAQEVKDMAEQSKQSTAQVTVIISEIQQATNAAAVATELGGKAVDVALQQSSRAGESIAVLAGSVMESAQAAAQIAVSNQQQVAGVEQVATSMALIRDACSEQLVAIKHVETAANRLNDIGVELKMVVKKYDNWSNMDLLQEQLSAPEADAAAT